MQGQYLIYYWIFCISLSSYAMHVHDIPDNRDIMQKLQALCGKIQKFPTFSRRVKKVLKKNNIKGPVSPYTCDEILLAGEFPTSTLDEKTIKTLKKEGQKIISDFGNTIDQHGGITMIENWPVFKERNDHKRRRPCLKKKLLEYEHAVQNGLDLEVSKNQSLMSWELLKKNKIDIVAFAVVATASILFFLKIIPDEKTDEELLADFNTTINNEQISDKAKAAIVRRVMHRLIDREKEMPLALLKSVLKKYIRGNEIVCAALTTKRYDGPYPNFFDWLLHGNYPAKSNKNYVYPDDFYDYVYNIIFRRTLEKSDIRALEILLSYNLYQVERCFGHRRDEIVNFIFTAPESEKKEKCILLFKQQGYHEILTRFPEYRLKDDHISNVECDERVEKYMMFLLPYMHDSADVWNALYSIECSTSSIGPEIYRRLQNILLDRRADSCRNCGFSKFPIDRVLDSLIDFAQKFSNPRFKSEYLFSDFVQSRIDGTDQLLRHGGRVKNNIGGKKELIGKSENYQYDDHISAKNGNIVCHALDEIAIKIGKEKKFREQFFNYDHRKNYYQLLEVLRRDYPRPAWWMLRVLDDYILDNSKKNILRISSDCLDRITNPSLRNISKYGISYIFKCFLKQIGNPFSKKMSKEHIKDVEQACLGEIYRMTPYDIGKIDASHILQFCLDHMYDMYSRSMSEIDTSHVPQFCFDQMNTLFSSHISDRAMKHEMQSWKELMFFLLSKTPDIFKDKKVLLETSKQEEYTVCYQDKKRDLEQLMLRIVEEGYSEKPKTYKLLRPLLIHCIETSEFVLDVSVQNGTEGSLIHLLCRVPFDVPMLRIIFKTYQKKDPKSLYLACFKNNKTRFKEEQHSTPKDLAKTWSKQCNGEAQIKAYQEVLSILRYDIVTVKRNASAHCPHVDNEIGELSDLKKTIEWKIAHCPFI